MNETIKDVLERAIADKTASLRGAEDDLLLAQGRVKTLTTQRDKLKTEIKQLKEHRQGVK